MSKTETIDTVARSAEISKAVAERVVEAFEARLKAHGDAGKRIVIRGFGSFSRACRARRPGAIRAPASRSLTPRTTSRRTSRRWPNRACAARLPPTRKSVLLAVQIGGYPATKRCVEATNDKGPAKAPCHWR